MPEIFEALPGIEVPVGEINQRLSALWTETATDGKPAPAADDAKATQVNLVLHLGLNTTPEDAAAQFQVVGAFSRRYPSRIVVLCPIRGEDKRSASDMRAKIYGECYLGKSKSDKRCVEFVMLSYPRVARPYLENQVSICLSADLPLYYWAHRFTETVRLADYRHLLSRAKRVLLDSAIAPADAPGYPWPNPKGLRDLVYSRLLPVRQTIGQFLASYPPATLVDGLREVTIAHHPRLIAEARALAGWFGRRLAACGAPTNLPFRTEALSGGATPSFAVRFDYGTQARHFRWTGDLTTKQAIFEAELGGSRTRLPAGVSLLTPENALSEAMFF
ncbi:MAG: glucose-6-phosphate dehydrogenase assembly protein OpcA [Opitutaceae bacterium]